MSVFDRCSKDDRRKRINGDAIVRIVRAKFKSYRSVRDKFYENKQLRLFHGLSFQISDFAVHYAHQEYVA